MFPLEEKSYFYTNEQYSMLNDFLFSNGVKGMPLIIVGKNGSLNSVMKENLRNDLLNLY